MTTKDIANNIFFLLILSFTLTSCKVQNVESHQLFLADARKSFLSVPESIITEQCLFNGFILIEIDIDMEGQGNFQLLYSSSEIFQEEFFEPLKKVNTSSLGKGKKYLLPIAFKSTGISKNETPCNRTLEYHKSTIGTDSYHVDYVFQTLEYIRLVNPSGLQKEVKYEIPPPTK